MFVVSIPGWDGVEVSCRSPVEGVVALLPFPPTFELPVDPFVGGLLFSPPLESDGIVASVVVILISLLLFPMVCVPVTGLINVLLSKSNPIPTKPVQKRRQ